ncbi:gp042 [Rhodococcus phage ReqiDocB7]|uniref:RusA-like Holliday junction resolvase n=1 Tax=Rhodococcus phage ReqiDocB7 TaxID=691966 RepID=UPI0001CDD76C|nr:RusA-like Holliday junction resolvase [Rhodococcus phage ReqiDocB7]ADD80828.1 gp042 [Rhodococcus phage ReqiDocB7]
MSNIVAYALPLNPEPWAIGDVSIRRVPGTKKLSGSVGPNKNLVVYQNAVKDELTLLGARVLPGDYALRFSFSRQVYGYKVTTDSRTSTRNGADATNLQKGTEDALQGVLIEDDRDVIRVESVMIDQGPDALSFVLIELKYGIKDNEPSHFGTYGLTAQGIAALELMERREKERRERKANSNVWRP